MSQEIAVVFTAKSVERILAEGGTSSWRLDRNHARQCAYAVCTRNAYADWVEGPEAHHSAFLIGKVSDVVPARDSDPGRYLIQFSEYAEIESLEFWKGDRNPVRYATLDALAAVDIDPAKLNWKPMPKTAPPAAVIEGAEPAPLQTGAIRPLTMSDAKKGLALTFGVPPEAIEITVHG